LRSFIIRTLPDVRINLGLVFIRTVASRVGLAGHLAVVEGRRNARNVMVGKLKGRGHLEDLGIDGRII
jgi:hypothetical protein